MSSNYEDTIASDEEIPTKQQDYKRTNYIIYTALRIVKKDLQP